MSMLDTIGGLAGGLGGSGGVGGSIPSNSSAANSAATATIQPQTTVSGVGGGGNQWGPFSVNFPGIDTQGSDSINAPFFMTSIIPKGSGVLLLLLSGLVALIWFYKR